jgi:multisubunit Na+/H+ antiporter MnhC subunit
MTGGPLRYPVEFMRVMLGASISRLGDARRRGDRGASAIELAIITAIIVGLALVVLLVVNTIVRNRANEINTNNNQLP